MQCSYIKYPYIKYPYIKCCYIVCLYIKRSLCGCDTELAAQQETGSAHIHREVGPKVQQ